MLGSKPHGDVVKVKVTAGYGAANLIEIDEQYESTRTLWLSLLVQLIGDARPGDFSLAERSKMLKTLTES